MLAWQMVKYTVKGSRRQELNLLWSRMGESQVELLVYQQVWTGEAHMIMDRYEIGDS